MTRECFALLFVVATAGCGDDAEPADAGRVDAGPAVPDAGAVDAGVGPSAVAPTASPDHGPCPDGWSSRLHEATGARTCWPAAPDAPTCGPRELRTPGAGCRPVSVECPERGFPPDLPDDAVHVRAGAADGDGSAGAPFGTIMEAVAAAPEGGVVAVAPGEYREAVFVRGRVLTLRGACLDVVVGDGSPPAPLVALDGAVTVSDLVLAGASVGVLSNRAEVTLERVVIEGASGTTLGVTDGGATVRDSLLLGPGDLALQISRSDVTLDSVEIRDAASGVAMLGGSLHARDAWIGGVGGESHSTLLSAFQAADVRLEAVAFVGNASAAGILASDAAVLRLDHTLLDARGATSVEPSALLSSLNGATVVLERSHLLAPRLVAIEVGGAGAELAARDVLVEEVRLARVGVLEAGYALEVSSDGLVELERVAIDRASGIAILVTGAGAEVEGADVTIVDTRPFGNQEWGRALHVQSGGRARLERAALRGHHELAVAATVDGEISLLDTVIADTRARPCAAEGCPGIGIGVASYVRAAVRLERFRVERAALAGVQVALGGSIDLVDGVIEGNPVGANVQIEGYDLARLTDRVFYRDNGVNLDAATLSLPETDPAD